MEGSPPPFPPPFPPPSLWSPEQPDRSSEMAIPPHVADDSSFLWDWDDLLDLTGDGVHLPVSLDSSDQPFPGTASLLPEGSSESRETEQAVSPLPRGDTDRIRKRDPRLICSNFLAGRIPCACPEIDEAMKAEEEGTPAKKRARAVRAAAGMVRCQVQGCEADIRELKGYHRRHRVCLRCANASIVLFDGQKKRYCQQCGKFHFLSDFDEDKHSCRRKLERHNNRRRRKPQVSTSLLNSIEKESQVDTVAMNCGSGDETGKEGSCPNRQAHDGKTSSEPEDVHLPTACSVPASENIGKDSFESFGASGDAQVHGRNSTAKCTLSSVYSDSKSAYSSICPTGRISFKLYDWNPAEFPRRLRHQIFQWLASMPVELEGYIRPGCTILTAFIAMPSFMWVKLHCVPALYLHDIVVAPQGMLSGKGRIFIHMKDMGFYADGGVPSITKMVTEVQAPKLHYVEPLCFEAGRPMELFACGSNLCQTKFRFLVSFSGNYLDCDNCIAVSYQGIKQDTDCTLQNQLYKLHIAHTEPDCFGPAFIEVENEFGLSNFFPILIGDEGICSEVKRLQQEFDACCGPKRTGGSVSSQTAISELILDIAWLLREPSLDYVCHHWLSSQVRRFSCLLSYLLENDCVAILARMLKYMEIVTDHVEWKGPLNDISDADMKLLKKNIICAKDALHEESQRSRGFALDLGNAAREDGSLCFDPGNDSLLAASIKNQVMEVRGGAEAGAIPLLEKQVVVQVKPVEVWSRRRTCGRMLRTRWFVAVIAAAAAAVCMTMCAVLYHPTKAGELVGAFCRYFFDGTA